MKTFPLTAEQYAALLRARNWCHNEKFMTAVILIETLTAMMHRMGVFGFDKVVEATIPKLERRATISFDDINSLRTIQLKDEDVTKIIDDIVELVIREAKNL